MNRGGLKDAMLLHFLPLHRARPYFSAPETAGEIKSTGGKWNCALGLPFLLGIEHATCKGSWHTAALRLEPAAAGLYW